ncbi:Uncharacterised protein [Enterobacter cloacae]|nr:Uncharacterised protein [Enterobacter cloacae]
MENNRTVWGPRSLSSLMIDFGSSPIVIMATRESFPCAAIVWFTRLMASSLRSVLTHQTPPTGMWRNSSHNDWMPIENMESTVSLFSSNFYVSQFTSESVEINLTLKLKNIRFSM